MSRNSTDAEFSFDAILNNLKSSGTDSLRLAQRLEDLKAKKKVYSDVISHDTKGNELQWVNFVQEGGGTLGISLVGFAFVLEYVGIRFLKLAGTSAGAINTIFLVAIGKKDDPKTPELYNILTDPSRLDLKSFVDSRYKLVRELLFSLGKGSGLLKKVIYGYLGLLLLVLIPLPLLSALSFEVRIIYYIFLGIFVLATSLLIFLLYRLGKFNYGINPGAKFTAFLKQELTRFGVATTADLDVKGKGAEQFEVNSTSTAVTPLMVAGSTNSSTVINKLPDVINDYSPELFLSLRADVKYVDEPHHNIQPEYQNIEFDYSFVTTDINNKCKVVFPKDADLYFADSSTVNPAEYVRASMAIPIFFEPQFFPLNTGLGNSRGSLSEDMKAKWLEKKGIEKVEQPGVLIDGGSISNFPINLFHNSKLKTPRVPVIGARIQDEDPEKRKGKSKRLTIGYLVGGIISTLRENEDSSFLGANPFYRRFCIENIKAFETKVNWLNFNLTKKEKDTLFIKGAEAAIQYLEKFDWNLYKSEREKF